MQHLLSSSSADVLKQLATEDTLCGFDFDGTLSPIVPNPDQAEMRARTRELLSQVAERYPCVIVSGRARADVLSKLGGVPVTSVIGNHGAETDAANDSARPLVEEWIDTLENRLESGRGVWMEDKGLSVAVHYRHAPDKVEARRKVLAAARELSGVRVTGGKQVVNLTIEQAPDKGDALANERNRLGCDWVLYVGDDENDEDAFGMEGNVVPVRIGRRQRSKARYFLQSQGEIDELLESLIQLRSFPGATNLPRVTPDP